MLDSEGASNGVNIGRLPVLFIRPNIDCESRVTLAGQKNYEMVYNLFISQPV